MLSLKYVVPDNILRESKSWVMTRTMQMVLKGLNHLEESRRRGIT
jgi:hypothetical protein